MSKLDSNGALVPAKSAELARKDSAPLARRGLQDLQQVGSADEWFQRANLFYKEIEDLSVEEIKRWSEAEIERREVESFACLVRAIEIDPNHVQALGRIGLAYESGLGVSENLSQAAAYYRRAADLGDAQAQWHLAQMYLVGRGVQQDPNEAAVLFLKAVQQDAFVFPYQMMQLAWKLYKGEGIPQDKAHAALWFHRAAHYGESEAQVQLAWMYYRGESVPKDMTQAAEWFRAASEVGDACVQNVLSMGWRLYRGDGTARDLAESARSFRGAAFWDDTSWGNQQEVFRTARTALGEMYAEGNGVPRDQHQADFWFSKAEMTGDPVAQCQLGRMYLKGEGVSRNPNQARIWLQASAEQGNAEAQEILGQMAAEESSAPKS